MSIQNGSTSAGATEDAQNPVSAEDRWLPYDTPRIRHITGIRIHQLTLPESLLYASKLVSAQSSEGDAIEPLSPVGESSRRRLSTSSTVSYPFPRRSFELDLDKRERSSSTSTARPLDPPSPSTSTHHPINSPRNRVTRPRAPTLAGEALEHRHNFTSSPGIDKSGSTQHEQADTGARFLGERRPVRCFIALKFPQKSHRPSSHSKGEDEDNDEPRRRTKSDERDLRLNGHSDFMRKVSRRTSSNSLNRNGNPNTTSLPNTPVKPSLRHTISSSSSHSSLLQTTPPRSRTVSLTTPAKTNGKINDAPQGYSLGRSSSRLSDDSSVHSIVRSPPPAFRAPNLLGKSKASLSVSHHFAHAENSPTQSTFTAADQNSDPASGDPDHSSEEKEKERLKMERKLKSQAERQVEIPFYISPIHPPSTNPRFQGLEANDLANWLTSTQLADSRFNLEIWVELPSGQWKTITEIGGSIDLAQLRRGPSPAQINGIEFTLSQNPKEVYHVPTQGELETPPPIDPQRGIGIMERSLRETRMEKGVTFGGLHHLINLQAVIADTQRSIEEVRRKVDNLLLKDADCRGLRRDISERQARVEWFGSKISEVEKHTRETQARTTLKQQDLDVRRDNLDGAEEADELRRGRGRDLEDEIGKIETDRLALLPQIHLLRAHHIQTLDSLFPIQPLDPSQLLYTILGVPLPIPIGSKDPAPPPTMPEYKVDEKTTAAALGYVALTVQILGSLGGATGGLPYPITCAGSRSSVRDGTGVMQGPRSFPLYSKGVDRYRYEYAVFLLNTNIEMLMQESSIRLLDRRHTLPNLKNLLLTLSSPNLPQPQLLSRSTMTSRNVSYRSVTPTPTLLGSGSGAWSRASSNTFGDRQKPGHTGSMSPSSTRTADDQSPLKINTLNSPSPLRAIRRSQENRGKYGALQMHNQRQRFGSVDLGSDSASDSEEEKDLDVA
ncbi:uncharacterized protein I303_103939 [Kwoniella dejecticola CBS 10117]|uniref:UV radiation resistance-associated gene protein n=1 Tax=Kwoniella dejecticola CBS 10117 TaxID=1296121 RepID=A0A1A6A857_9TREE|nr:uncharacterized protein I303_03956 [Kwoniella dejecticola CBS 10117]OBR86236.1 hypothetical protein I303_03956 [Kwoniella dejecticola CBS 10117]